MRDGYRNQCRICDKLKKYDWDAGNPDKRRAQLRRSYQKNKVTRDAVTKAYRDANLEQHRAWDRARYLRNREKMRKQGRAHYQANKEKYAEYRDKRLAMLRGVEGQYTRDDVWKLYDEQSGFCYYCDIPLFGSFHVDHKQPVSRGGTNRLTNLAITCATCNLRKQDKTEDEFWEVLLR